MFEKKLINTILTISLALGFLCLITVYLPQKLQGNETKVGIKNTQTINLSSIFPEEKKGEITTGQALQQKAGGVYTSFTPTPDPALPELFAKNTGSAKDSRTAEKSEEFSPSKIRGKFKIPPSLEADVAFWRYIYGKYNSDQVVFHDPKYLHIIYRVLDFKNYKNLRLSENEIRKARGDRVELEKEKIIAILEKLSDENSSGNLSSEEYRIKKLFDNVNEIDRFKKASERGIRAQEGQKNKFLEGLKYSGRYLGEIESIFELEGLPPELTRLIFVESMFNPRAHSSAGAKGIWQFMESTARHYSLNINSTIDERADPIIASYAAANLLKDNYQELGKWELAVNAYNAGKGRLKQAIRELGTSDITRIIKEFEHPSYGFASRNFYLEFLAALDITQNYEHYFGDITFDEPVRCKSVTLGRSAPLTEIAKLYDISEELLAELNPHFKTCVINGQKKLPSGTVVRIPRRE